MYDAEDPLRGNDSIPVMKENPYKLADDIWEIGFKTADQIATKLGFGKESYLYRHYEGKEDSCDCRHKESTFLCGT